jgi:hypothetical protein
MAAAAPMTSPLARPVRQPMFASPPYGGSLCAGANGYGQSHGQTPSIGQPTVSSTAVAAAATSVAASPSSTASYGRQFRCSGDDSSSPGSSCGGDRNTGGGLTPRSSSVVSPARIADLSWIGTDASGNEKIWTLGNASLAALVIGVRHFVVNVKELELESQNIVSFAMWRAIVGAKKKKKLIKRNPLVRAQVSRIFQEVRKAVTDIG